ncbi:sugar kinase [Blastochloris viridis]|uniref:2-dehydro-3-deoxygluconate kinase n=1 Tax=Blastochloris viridis TaxID=1079 RepID=A0A0H5B8H9_BLAVI|nr:sugar kinase [Blastochloris viridis]ALK08235.1 2-dehydro-3-deoxygluconokinase [Blastochloris viridis]BAR98500.1 2-dehydro-3-deoxygluconate kinase [Blastochloris viridis]CUU44157.1 putative sugar kinase ydjH [Blastochloris viridis]
MSRVVAIGEVLVELSRGGDGRYGLSFGGDCFSTAVYLARLGVPTAFATALGDDPYSRAIIAAAEAAGLATGLTVRIAGGKPGLVLVDTDEGGERRVQHWRDGASVRHLFTVEGWGLLAEAMTQASLIYLSGATLSLFDNVGLGRLLATLEVARERGAKVAFDGNFAPSHWGGDIARARAVYAESLKRIDIALLRFADEALLFGEASPEATFERFAAAGIGEIVLKTGADGVLLRRGGETVRVPAAAHRDPADPAADDAFNAGYLAARLAEQGPDAAALAGHRLAAELASNRGAIQPRTGANGHGDDAAR